MIRNRVNYIRTVGLFLALFIILSASFTQSVQAQADSEVHLTILHLNDVYEIQPVSGGTQGGIARVATLKKQLLAENPNTFITFSGDLYGPSGLSNVAIVNGQQLAGEQAVAVMNLVGIDYFTFGDHEFDMFPAEQTLARLAETQFPMISSNIFDADGNPFSNVAVNDIFTVTNEAGASVRVGIFGITEPIRVRSGKLQITRRDHIEAAAEQVQALDGQVDILIAMTHFSVNIDIDIAQQFPEIDLILGGDDHEHMRRDPGPGLAPIFKSDSNARNVQIIDIFFNTATGELRIEDRLQPITDSIPDDPEVLAEVDRWLQIGFDALRQQGFDPERVVGQSTVDLDGFATSIRNGSNAFTQLILRGIDNATQDSDLNLLTSAFIRLDDLIPAGGNFTEYDVIRTFPFEGLEVSSWEMLGSALQTVLNEGQAAAGSGNFLLHSENVTRTPSGEWLIDGESIDPNRTYRVGASSFFFPVGITDVDLQLAQTYDMELRQVLIDQLTLESSEEFDNAFFMSLSRGLNMISLPLMPQTPLNARSFAEQIGATIVVRLEKEARRFVGWTPDAPDDGFPIEGAKGYIVNVPEATSVTFTGEAWTNTRPVEQAPILTSRESSRPTNSSWAFVVSGKMVTQVEDGYLVTVRNTRTNKIATGVIKSGYFAATFADLSRKSVVNAGDRLEVVVMDKKGGIASEPVFVSVTPDMLSNVNVMILLTDIGKPSQSRLFQNYPNPFNPETWIPYRLAESAVVTIQIYNIHGELVRTLDLGQQAAGFYQSRHRAAYWHGKNEKGEEVGSGVYFYHLNAGDFSETQRMVIVK